MNRSMRLRRNAVFCIPSFCVQWEEDGGCGLMDRYICLQLCTRIRNFCTFTYDNDARAYNYGTTFYKNNEKTKMQINTSSPQLLFIFHSVFSSRLIKPRSIRRSSSFSCFIPEIAFWISSGFCVFSSKNC